MHDLQKRYGDRVEFVAVYLREAHPTDGWRRDYNDLAGILVNQPKTLSERQAVAQRCCSTLDVGMPMVVDEIDDRVGRAYAAMPDRLYVLGRDGRVAYKGGAGPFGFNPSEMEQTLLLMRLDEKPVRPNTP